jgi:hypothetical protein
MTNPSDNPAKSQADAAKLALQLKRKAAAPAHAGSGPGLKRTERDAAARSAAKSKPMLRK